MEELIRIVLPAIEILKCLKKEIEFSILANIAVKLDIANLLGEARIPKSKEKIQIES